MIRRQSRQVLIFSIIFITMVFTIMAVPPLAQAQSETEERVQIINGQIVNDETNDYTIPSLIQGDKLYVHVVATSGNLDPFIALQTSENLSGTREGEFAAAVQEALDNNRDPLLLVSEFADENFIAWDDDSGSGFSAAFEYTIPSDGDYHLFVLSSPFTDSFGEFKLTVGLNAPEAQSGSAISKGSQFVFATSRTETKHAAVQEISAAISEDGKPQRHRLQPFAADDTLYVYIETTDGDLIPQMILWAFGTKPIRTANIAGSQPSATLEYSFPSATEEYLIEVMPKPGTAGSYRLLVGRNEPAVLAGEIAPFGELLLHEPINASVGVFLQQISNIDQKAENFEAVATTVVSWQDPALAFRVDECECESKVFTANDFVSFATREKLVWPEFTYLNQQNNRWIQNEYVGVDPSGRATYFERFTTTFQAPDFDFHKFPFDTQTFFIRIDSLYNTSFIQFSESDFTRVGTQLGEEEWYVTHWETEVFEEPSSTGVETASFVFRFFANRHLSFYVFRIFVPLILIISVTWITFFMADYGKRVDATTANLLLFIAFNFTIADDLPRLGYLTYMDTLLVGAFGISVLVVVYNVFLNRQIKRERENWVIAIDKYMIWLYPLAYAIAFLAITWAFFW
jgi:hypothetical protein